MIIKLISASNRFGLTALRFANLGGYEAIVTLINNEPKKRTREYNRACRRAWCRGIRNLENLEKVVGKRRTHYDANGTEEEQLLKFFRGFPGLRKLIGGYMVKFYNPTSSDEFAIYEFIRLADFRKLTDRSGNSTLAPTCKGDLLKSRKNPDDDQDPNGNSGGPSKRPADFSLAGGTRKSSRSGDKRTVGSSVPSSTTAMLASLMMMTSTAKYIAQMNPTRNIVQ